jgi:hypothetical protein
MSLLLAIIGHLVGDYLLQNDWMALNKKKWKNSCPINCLEHRILDCFNFPCFVHCVLWTLAVCLFSGWHSIPVIAFLFVTHYIQDRTQIIGWWMRLKWKDQSKFAEPPMAPWSLIVVDNVWHIVTIWAVWKLLINK